MVGYAPRVRSGVSKQTDLNTDVQTSIATFDKTTYPVLRVTHTMHGSKVHWIVYGTDGSI